MTPSTREELLDVLDAAVPLFIRDKDFDSARTADRLRRALDAAQAAPAELPTPQPGIAGLLAALQRAGTADWRKHGYPSREAAAKAIWRAAPGRWRTCDDGTVKRRRRKRPADSQSAVRPST
jgi:hypothetical protein